MRAPAQSMLEMHVSFSMRVPCGKIEVSACDAPGLPSEILLSTGIRHDPASHVSAPAQSEFELHVSPSSRSGTDGMDTTTLACGGLAFCDACCTLGMTMYRIHNKQQATPTAIHFLRFSCWRFSCWRFSSCSLSCCSWSLRRRSASAWLALSCSAAFASFSFAALFGPDLQSFFRLSLGFRKVESSESTFAQNVNHCSLRRLDTDLKCLAAACTCTKLGKDRLLTSISVKCRNCRNDLVPTRHARSAALPCTFFWITVAVPDLDVVKNRRVVEDINEPLPTGRCVDQVLKRFVHLHCLGTLRFDRKRFVRARLCD